MGTFAIAGMGALFAATVRANWDSLSFRKPYQLILPPIITCIGATMMAQFLGGKPLYSVLLEKTLARSEKKQLPPVTDKP